jgi:C1A family cysteine protease
MVFGWVKDEYDPRDFKFKVTMPVDLPEMVDLRSKCPVVYNQGSLGSCHDGYTEVLSIDGWKLFKDITKEDKLATVNPKTNEIIYEHPTNIVTYKYDGDIYKSNNRNLDFVMTPNHNMLVRKWNERERTLSDDYELIEVQNMGWYVGLMNSVKQLRDDIDEYVIGGVEHKHKKQRDDKKVVMSDWLKFLGIFVAEGTLLKEEYKIQLAAVKDREKEYIRNILIDLDIHALELKDRFTFENKQIYSELDKLGFGGIKSYEKFVPKFIFDLSYNQISYFLQGHAMGDGCEQNSLWSHYTSSERLSNELLILILLSGKWGSISKREPRNSIMKDGRVVIGKHPEYRVSVWKKTNLSIERKSQILIEKYSDYVYCAEVPTYHTLVTKRNGKMLISGNCTANALGAAYQFEQMKQKRPNFIPSRLFIYYNERVLENSVHQDNGAMIRTGIKTMVKEGVCPETMWKYNIKKFTQKPPQNCYDVALDNQVLQYLRISPHTVYEVKHCLSEGYPVVFGFMLFESIMSAEVRRTGYVPMPKANEKCLGGHAVMAVGYDDEKEVFIVRNSWGTDWGIDGYFYLPYGYISQPNLSADFWTIRLVE